MLFLLQLGALNTFIFFKIYTTDQKQKGKDYAFKDLLLDYVKKMTESAQREGENDDAED
jgi:hypothetical protein